MRGLSLRAKVFLMFAATSLLIVAPALLLIAQAVERGVYERAREELAGARVSMVNQWEGREDGLANAAQLRALDSVMVRAWQAGRLASVERRMRAALDKDLPVVIDSTGTTRVGPRLSPAAISAAGEGAGTAVTIPDSTRVPVRYALAPVWADTVRMGLVGVASPVSAQGFKKNLGGKSDVVLMMGDSLVDTTLPDSVRGRLSRDALELLVAGGSTPRQLNADQAYMAAPVTLPANGPTLTAVLLRPITQELEVATAIKRSLFGIGFAALLLALVLAALVSRIVARPTQALADASARMARGDFAAPLPRAGTDEIGQLARAFGEMRRAIADRESRLRSAQAEMIHREKLAAMGRLVAQLSHEINNPIYNIQNCLEALERRGNPADPNREFLTLAQEELARMASLTRRLLDQSRPQSDASSLLNLNALVGRVVTLARPELEARGVEVAMQLAPDLPPVVAHPEAIQQVLANLVANAGDAMPGGGRLLVATRADAEAVEVVVEDTGAGISEADLPHIFEAFYTTKPGVTGIGLGLFVSEGIIRGHRGRIDVESAPGRGSRFVVRLPRETLDESVTLADGTPVREAVAAD
ncbi:MAG TPA: HAMP domain-containing sensor histidine kinase [Longimicrobium sp.]